MLGHRFVALPLVFALFPTDTQAAEPRDFHASLEQVLRAPATYLSSTTPASPLITHDNALDRLWVTTPRALEGAASLIERAESEILYQVYEYSDEDEAGHLFFDALSRRVKRAIDSNDEPLTIRVLVSDAMLQENPLKQRDLQGLIESTQNNPRARGRVRIELSRYRGLLLSILHTKTLIIDSHTALVMTGNLTTHGGIAQDSFNLAAEVRGPVVKTLRDDWLSARRLATLDRSVKGGAFDDEMVSASSSRRSMPQEPGQLIAAVLARPSNWTPWLSTTDNPQDRGLVALIDAATHHIDIINPSLSVPVVHQALIRAIRDRGVHVRALLSFEMNRWREHHLFGGDNVEQVYKLYAELLATGGHALADKLSIRWGALDGRTPSSPHSPGNIHAKVINFDNHCLWVGSTNLNQLSWNNSRELGVALMGKDVGLEFHDEIFAKRWTMGAPFVANQISLSSSPGWWPSVKRAATHVTDPVFTYLRASREKTFDDQAAHPDEPYP